MIVTRHLEPLYGIDTVLRAFRQVQAWYPEASLCVAGTGSQESYLRGRMSEWGLKNVDFVGYMDHSRLPDLYDECDILLNGSRVDNFPASLLEASAAGLVVVSTNAGGIPFIYENGKNAVLVETEDSNALAAGVRRIVEDQMFARDLVSAALEQSRQFDWTNVSRALYARYGFSLPSSSGAAASALDPFESTGGLP
jgi:glycosyltransferase involved in cell wall biosynthesis